MEQQLMLTDNTCVQQATAEMKPATRTEIYYLCEQKKENSTAGTRVGWLRGNCRWRVWP